MLRCLPARREHQRAAAPPPRWIITKPGARTPRVARSASARTTVSRSMCSGCTKVEQVCVQQLGAANIIHSAAVANCMTSSRSAPTTCRNEVRHAGDEVVQRLRRAAIGSQPTTSGCERASSQRVVPGIRKHGRRGQRGTSYAFYLGRSLQASPCNRSSK